MTCASLMKCCYLTDQFISLGIGNNIESSRRNVKIQSYESLESTCKWNDFMAQTALTIISVIFPLFLSLYLQAFGEFPRTTGLRSKA